MLIKFIISCVLFFAFLSALPGAEKNTDVSIPHIRKLIKQLGAEKYEVREKAAHELVSFGYYARNEVEKACEDSISDPEVKVRLCEIRKKLQWSLFPGAGNDIAVFMKVIQPGAYKYKKWTSLSKKYGPKLFQVLLYLSSKTGYKRQAVNGLTAIFSESSLSDIAAYLKSTGNRDRIIDMILSLPLERLDEKTSSALLSVFFDLGLNNEALLAAGYMWEKSSTSNVPEKIREKLQNSYFIQDMFEFFLKHINHVKSSERNDWLICFSAKIAKDAGRKKELVKFLNDVDYQIGSTAAAVYLAEILISMKLNDEAVSVLAGFTSPRTIYLRALAYHNAKNRQDERQMMDILYTRLTTEKACYDVLREMDKFKDIRAVTLLHHIIDMKPDNTKYDSNARMRLAEFYESVGKYGKAADLLKELLPIVQKEMFSGINLPAESELRAKVDDLMQREKGGAVNWYNALKSMKRKQYADAVKQLNTFIEKNPSYPQAYSMKAEALRLMKENKEAVAAMDKAIQLTADRQDLKIEFMLRKVFMLTDIDEYQQAAQVAKEAYKMKSDDARVVSVYAVALFYALDFAKSAKIFAKNQDLDNEDLYAPVWRYIALGKTGQDGSEEFKDYANVLTSSKWPVPVIRYLTGKLSEKECLDAADDKDSTRQNEKKCEAYYYIGEKLLLDGKKDEAAEMFRKCLACNIPDFRETVAAKQRLQELQKK